MQRCCIDWGVRISVVLQHDEPLQRGAPVAKELLCQLFDFLFILVVHDVDVLSLQ